MPDSFSQYHPLVNFLWFTGVLLFAMLLMHPVCLGISFLASIFYAYQLKGGKALRFQLKVTLPLLLFTAILSPLFNHQGMTILLWLPNGNPLTLESILYGLGAAVMLVTVLNWFTCLQVILTSDKFIWLFGRLIPSLSLVLSMVLRFVPLFSAQLKRITAANRAAGVSLKKGPFAKLKNALTLFSALVTWSLENAIQTADSMKSRGYGLPGRTAYSLYTLSRRDKVALVLIVLLVAFLSLGAALDGFFFQYYPFLSGALLAPLSLCLFGVYLAFCLLPMVINRYEEEKWHYSKSGI